jgi:protein-tyrosine-phosphatase/DNA-binding transcriptional ArsR family regulator
MRGCVSDLEARAAVHAALGDPSRLAIVDRLVACDRSPVELRQLTGMESNLLAHHLDVLEGAGLIVRRRSSGDRRRRYVQLVPSALSMALVRAEVAPQPATFVCTHNSARSQLAAALWTAVTAAPADSAGTQPVRRVHPGAVDAARRAGLDLSGAVPRELAAGELADRLVVTVCDRAHEELEPEPAWLHWSVPDPVVRPTKAGFDRTVVELRRRITDAIGRAS